MNAATVSLELKFLDGHYACVPLFVQHMNGCSSAYNGRLGCVRFTFDWHSTSILETMALLQHQRKFSEHLTLVQVESGTNPRDLLLWEVSYHTSAITTKYTWPSTQRTGKWGNQLDLSYPPESKDALQYFSAASPMDIPNVTMITSVIIWYYTRKPSCTRKVRASEWSKWSRQ